MSNSFLSTLVNKNFTVLSSLELFCKLLLLKDNKNKVLYVFWLHCYKLSTTFCPLRNILGFMIDEILEVTSKGFYYIGINIILLNLMEINLDQLL